MAFLTAHWRDLLMINWPLDPERVGPWVPAGCEVDEFGGCTYASLVAFQFHDTRVMGIRCPGYVHFEEVNLRLYVTHTTAEGELRRGVVFVREIVPRRLIAWIARTVYGEPYDYMPMSHRRESQVDGRLRLEYQWGDHQVSAVGGSEIQELEPGSEPQFIAEHYWGYTARPAGTRQYRVNHPPWRWRSVESVDFQVDMGQLYGSEWSDLSTASPSSQFIAEGSDVSVDPWGKLP